MEGADHPHGHTVAIVPARAGSKGLPGKNLRLLDSQPMLTHSVLAGLGCNRINDVIVATDDAKMLAVGMAAGASKFPLRPEDISTDEATTLAVLHWFVDTYKKESGKDIDHLVLLQPTSPLRTSQHVNEAIALYPQQSSPKTTVVSMTPSKPLAWQGSKNQQGYWQSVSKNLPTRRQDGGELLALNGAIYIGPTQHVLEHGFLAGSVIPYVMPANVSVDVDTLADFQLAEALLQLRT